MACVRTMIIVVVVDRCFVHRGNDQGVCPLMSMQVRRSIECFGANAARIGFRCRVRQFVSCQISRLTKGPVAYITDEGFFTCMNALEKKEKSVEISSSSIIIIPNNSASVNL